MSDENEPAEPNKSDLPPKQEQPNAGEGADPSSDIKQQNPGETTTNDLAQHGSAP